MKNISNIYKQKKKRKAIYVISKIHNNHNHNGKWENEKSIEVGKSVDIC